MYESSPVDRILGQQANGESEREHDTSGRPADIPAYAGMIVKFKYFETRGIGSLVHCVC